MKLETTLIEAVGQSGFLSHDHIKQLASLDRLRQVLIRCGNCRLVVAAQDVSHVISMIEASDMDYVRDVALLSTDRAFSRDFRPVTPVVAKSDPPVARHAVATTVGRSYSSCDIEPSDADPGL